MEQELASKYVPLSKKELERAKKSGIMMLRDLETEFRAKKISEFHYLIFKRGLIECIEGKLTKRI